MCSPLTREQVGLLTGRVCTLRPDRRCDCRPSPRGSSVPRPALPAAPRSSGGGAPRTAAAGLHGGGPGRRRRRRGGCTARVRALGFSVFGSRVMSSVPQVRQPFVLFCESPVSSLSAHFSGAVWSVRYRFPRVLRLLGKLAPGLSCVPGGKVSSPTFSFVSNFNIHIFAHQLFTFLDKCTGLFVCLFGLFRRFAFGSRW